MKFKNPIIASFFNQIGNADELGSGTRNLYKYSRRYSGLDPKLVEGDVFRIIIPLDDTYSFDGEIGEKVGEKIGISSRKVENNMKKLKDRGLLIRHGSPKKGYWEVVKE